MGVTTVIFTYELDLPLDVFHRNYVVSRIMRDRRTRAGKNQLLGYPFQHVRYSVIKNGSVDFDREYRGRFGRLCSDDLVALYRYLYMPRHIAEAMATFDRCSTWVATILNSTTITWMVDLGCGPGTAGLAFAGHCGGVTFNYDYSRALGMCHSPINVIFVTSYLFASTSLDIDAIIRSLKSVIDCDTVKEALFVYLNSTTRFANRFYERFVGCVDIVARSGIKEQTIQYRRYGGRATATARFVNDCLLLKESRP